MKKIGFNDQWVALIMKWCETFSTDPGSACIITQEILSGRGLPQGDPISPYLFLFCVQSHVNIAEQEGVLRGIKVCQNAPAGSPTVCT